MEDDSAGVLELASWKKGRKEGRKCFYLMTHLTHFIYGYLAIDGHMVEDHTYRDGREYFM